MGGKKPPQGFYHREEMMSTPQERINAANEKIQNGSYTTKEEKIALIQEVRAATKELIGDRDLTQP